jgi:BirA family biotin operon repressor/biotin-[acetyl-CoA-carboxylase] ligase
VSPAHLNLYLSVVLRPALAPSELARVTLVAAVATAQAIESATGLEPEIKWPNDILLGGRKTVGILTELEAEADRVRFAILGIGVNLNAGEGDFPPELRGKATSLALASGRHIDRAEFTGRLLEALDGAYDELLTRGFDGLKKRYEAYHGLVGRRVRVEGAARATGTVRGIDADGALLLDGPRGPERIVAGEVTLTGGYRQAKRRRRATLALPRPRA